MSRNAIMSATRHELDEFVDNLALNVEPCDDLHVYRTRVLVVAVAKGIASLY